MNTTVIMFHNMKFDNEHNQERNNIVQQEYKEILQAIIDGKTIQKRVLASNTETWHDCTTPKEVFTHLSKLTQMNEIRVKPSTININGFQVPEPVRHDLKQEQNYFYVSFEFDNGKAYNKDVWLDSYEDKLRLLAGMVHLTEEAVNQHSEALLSFTTKFGF